MSQRMPPLAGMFLAAVLGVWGCTPRQAPREPVATSYPSPDYPPAGGAPASPAPQALSAPAPLVERQLAAPAARQMPAPVAAPAAAPAPAAATPPPAAAGARPEAAFSAVDADGNGRVTLEEWRNYQEREFRRLDRNNDGVISREEPAASGPAKPAVARPAP